MHSATHAPLGGLLFTLITDEVDGWYEHLQSRDVAITTPPKLNETYGIYHFFVRDPNGYLIEIQRFLDPDWYEDKDGTSDERREPL